MKLTITAYSTALFSTWYFIEEWGILLDAGDGVSASLLQKSRKIEHIFISHADRDHLTGLLQLNQLNAREGFPKLFYPQNCGSFPPLAAFSQQFDPHVKGTIWKGIIDNEVIPIKENIFVQAIRNAHVKAEKEVFKSLGYQIFESKSKLKSAFLQLPQAELKNLIAREGKEKLTEKIRTNLLTYSGDTPIEKDFEKWNHTQILIHEATFLTKEEHNQLHIRGNQHSNLEEVIEMVAQLNIETLILGHFSSRYSHAQIVENVRGLCKAFHLKIPVYCVFPGQIHRNILEEKPIWE